MVSKSTIRSVAISPDGTYVLLAERDDAVYLPIIPVKLILEKEQPMQKFFILVACLSALVVNTWAAQPEVDQPITIYTVDDKEIKVARAVAELSNTIKD